MNKLSLPTTLRLSLKTMNSYGIWTGGANSKEMTAVNATSVLGGLRFWAEAMLRANGATACFEKERCGKCEACMTFGCTGISRAFSLQVKHENLNQSIGKATSPLPLPQYKYQNNRGETKTPRYYLTNGYTGQLDLAMAVRRPDAHGDFGLPPAMLTALYLMIEYGTVGAYDQYGCGLTGFADPDQKENLRELALLGAESASGGNGKAKNLALGDFFFFRGCVSKDKSREAMGEIRYLIRNVIRKTGDERLRHWFCGSLKTDQETFSGRANSGTNYSFSIDGNGKLYGWGHFGRAGNKYAGKREAVLDLVHGTLKKALGNSLDWKEFAAPGRDGTSPKDWPSYLGNLLKSDWRTL